MMGLKNMFLWALVALFSSGSIHATTIKILTSQLAGDITYGDGDDDLNTFYQKQGYDSSLFNGTVTAGELQGVSLFVAMLPDDAFSSSELTAISNYLATGGRVLLIGEQQGFASTQNGYLNSALYAIGSSLSIGSVSLDSGFNNTLSNQILSHPLTSGINLINYGNVNSINGVATDNRLFLSRSLQATWGAAESINGGTLVLVSDANMLSNLENTSANDNHQFFMNIVPEPGGGLFAALLVSMVTSARRR